MSRVSIEYDDDTTVDFAELSDALFHATQQGTAGVVNVREAASEPSACSNCGGTGVTGGHRGKVLWSRKQLDAKVASVMDESAVDASPDNRVSAARKIAKAE